MYIDTENLLFGAATEQLKVCVYRTGTIYGPQVGFVPRGLEAQTLPMAGATVPFDGNAPAAIVHRDDVVRALEFALDKELSGLHNLINDITDTKEVFFGRMIEAAGKDPINWVGAGTGPKSLSNQKIKDAGFSFGDPIAENDGSSFL